MKIKRFEFNMFPENCYVLWDETNEAVVIDPGCFYEEEKQALKNFIINNKLNVKHLLEHTPASGPYFRQSFHAERIRSDSGSQPSR